MATVTDQAPRARVAERLTRLRAADERLSHALDAVVAAVAQIPKQAIDRERTASASARCAGWGHAAVCGRASTPSPSRGTAPDYLDRTSVGSCSDLRRGPGASSRTPACRNGPTSPQSTVTPYVRLRSFRRRCASARSAKRRACGSRRTATHARLSFGTLATSADNHLTAAEPILEVRAGREVSNLTVWQAWPEDRGRWLSVTIGGYSPRRIPRALSVSPRAT